MSAFRMHLRSEISLMSASRCRTGPHRILSARPWLYRCDISNEGLPIYCEDSYPPQTQTSYPIPFEIEIHRVVVIVITELTKYIGLAALPHAFQDQRFSVCGPFTFKKFFVDRTVHAMVLYFRYLKCIIFHIDT